MTELSEQNSSVDIGIILKDLMKVIKIISMYPEDNPLPQSLKQSFAEKLEEAVANNGEIVVGIKQNKLLYQNAGVSTDQNDDSGLAALLFEAGITKFVFKPWLDVREILEFLDVMKEYVNSPDKTLDLAALIWECNFFSISFTTVEDISLSDYDANFNIEEFISSSESGYKSRVACKTDTSESYDSIFDNENSSIESVESDEINFDGPKVHSHQINLTDSNNPEVISETFSRIGLGGFNEIESVDEVEMGSSSDKSESEAFSTNTNFIMDRKVELSEKKSRAIAVMLQEDSLFDSNFEVIQLVKELLCQETELNTFHETLNIFEKVHTDLIKNGKLREGGYMLSFLEELEQRLDDKKPQWKELVHEARLMLGSRDRLTILSDALNAHEELSASELTRYLDNFGWETLSGISDLLGELEHRSHRETLRDWLTNCGKTKVDLVSKGIYDKRWYVVRNTVTILASIGDSRAMSYLTRVVEHPERRVRLELVNNLYHSDSEEALKILQELISDNDQEISLLAAKTLAGRRGIVAYNTLADIVNSDNFLNLADTTKRPLLIALSQLGGDEAVSYLNSLIVQLNPFGKSSLSFLRDTAFEALAHNRGEKSEKLLKKLSRSIRPELRRQATAMLERRQLLMDGNQ